MKKSAAVRLYVALGCVALGYSAGNLVLPRGVHGQDIVPAEFLAALLCETAETVRSTERHQGVTFRVFGLTPWAGRGLVSPVSVEEPHDAYPRKYPEQMPRGSCPEDRQADH